MVIESSLLLRGRGYRPGKVSRSVSLPFVALYLGFFSVCVTKARSIEDTHRKGFSLSEERACVKNKSRVDLRNVHIVKEFIGSFEE